MHLHLHEAIDLSQWGRLYMNPETLYINRAEPGLAAAADDGANTGLSPSLCLTVSDSLLKMLSSNNQFASDAYS